MNLIRQRNAHDCLIAAAAMAADLDYDVLLRTIGHDGSQIAFAHVADVQALRGFHEQEVTDALLKLGFTSTEIEVRPVTICDVDATIFEPFAEDYEERFLAYVQANRGVLSVVTDKAAGHAIAVDRGTCFDPKGRTYPFEDLPNQGVARVMSFRIIKSDPLPG